MTLASGSVVPILALLIEERIAESEFWKREWLTLTMVAVALITSTPIVFGVLAISATGIIAIAVLLTAGLYLYRMEEAAITKYERLLQTLIERPLA